MWGVYPFTGVLEQVRVMIVLTFMMNIGLDGCKNICKRLFEDIDTGLVLV